MRGEGSSPPPGSSLKEERYKYQPLSSTTREIRLLSLLPGDFRDPIECQIRHDDLDQKNLKYWTLSYVWGERKTNTSLSVDGQVVEVTSNLGHALRYLRKDHGELVIWVDALCINQENLDEKTQQVAMMRDIYRKCQGVNIWLGCQESMKFESNLNDSIPDVNPFTLFCHFADNKHVHDLPEFSLDPNDGLYFYAGSQENSLEYHHPIWSGIYKITKSPWWSRIWTVQETALPPTQIVLYGHHRILMRTLEEGVRNWNRHLLACCSTSFHGFPTHLSAPLRDLSSWLEFNKSMRSPPDGNSLRTLTFSFNWKRASNPRDKVFGLLGLVDETRFRSVVADYTLSPSQVYENAFRVMMEEDHGKLDCFCGSWFTSFADDPLQSVNAPRFPSWVPNFEASISSEVAKFEYLRDMLQIRYYNASGDTVSEASIDEHSRLHLNGKQVATVLFVADLSPFDDGMSDIRMAWVNPWQQRVEKFTGKFSYEEREMFFRTLIADLFYDAPNPIMAFTRTSELEKDFFGSWLDQENINSTKYDAAIVSIGFATAGRQFFVAEKGVMGLCYKHTQVGDEVWIFDGGKVPFVVRPMSGDDTGAYQFVGDCYMDGVMYGEALVNEKKDCWKRQEIVIK